MFVWKNGAEKDTNESELLQVENIPICTKFCEITNASTYHSIEKGERATNSTEISQKLL